MIFLRFPSGSFSSGSYPILHSAITVLHVLLFGSFIPRAPFFMRFSSGSHPVRRHPCATESNPVRRHPCATDSSRRHTSNKNEAQSSKLVSFMYMLVLYIVTCTNVYYFQCGHSSEYRRHEACRSEVCVMLPRAVTWRWGGSCAIGRSGGTRRSRAERQSSTIRLVFIVVVLNVCELSSTQLRGTSGADE